jgi:hypothetical protein
MSSPVVWTHTLDYKNYVQAKLGQDLGVHVLIWSWNLPHFIKKRQMEEKEEETQYIVYLFLNVLGYVLLVWVPVISFCKIFIPN